MSIFVRPVSTRCLVRLITLVTILFVLTSLLIMSVQEILDSSAYARAVASTSGSASDRCAALDIFGTQLGKILIDWDAGSQRRSVGEEPGDTSLTEAVRTLTDNAMMLEKGNVDRLLYLAEILQVYKEWMLQRREEEEHVAHSDEEGEEEHEDVRAEESADASVVELVKALENVTKQEGETVLPIFMNIYEVNTSRQVSALKHYLIFLLLLSGIRVTTLAHEYANGPAAKSCEPIHF